MMLKDNNFISAVVYLHNDGARAVEFCRTVAAELDAGAHWFDWLGAVDEIGREDAIRGEGRLDHGRGDHGKGRDRRAPDQLR